MILSDYLLKKNLTQEAFGFLVGVSRVQINRLVQGKRTPSFKLATKIKRVTKGEVSYEDLIEENLTDETPKE